MAIITTVKEHIGQMNQASFQILCDALLSKEGYSDFVALGTMAGKEKTTKGTPDTYFCLLGGKYVFAEYTTQKESLIKKIRSDIENCFNEEYTGVPLSEITEIIYCHTSSNIKPADDLKLKSICEEKGIKLTLIGIDSLTEKLMNYPMIIKEHLGLAVDSGQIQSLDDFVKQYNSNVMVATLETDFLFREKELNEIDRGFENDNTILLIGPSGTGKTRLALEYAKIHAKKYEEKLLCIHDRSLPMYEDLLQYFEKPGKYFVLLDDANQLSELKHILEYENKVNTGYHVRILMTVRDYAVHKVISDIRGFVHYKTIAITPFTDEEIVSLMKHHYEIHNQNYLDRIVQISEGNVRIAMLAGKIACDTNRLDAIYDVTELYTDYYGTVMEKSGINSNLKILVVSGIMAFLNSIHLDHIDAIIPILEEKGFTKDNFIESLNVLHENEIVDIYNDKGVRISDQSMANFVLKYVFFDKKVIKLSNMIESCFAMYRERTINAINTLIGVFHNTALQYYVEKEVRDLWSKLKNNKSPLFFEFLKSFFSVNELETLLIIQNHIENEKPIIMKAEEIIIKEDIKYQNISDDIITILGGFSYSENIDAALDLFFQYYLKRPDLYMQFYLASTSFFSIDKDSVYYGYQTQIKYFIKMSEYSQNGDNSYISVLFCNVASHFLMLEFTPFENKRKKIILYHIPIAIDSGVKEYRQLIWNQLLKLSSKELYRLSIIDVLRTYGNVFNDCSKEVVKFDAEYICKLSKKLLSPDCLADCLIVQSLNRTFKKADYYSEELQPFINNSQYKLYQITSGSKLDDDLLYDERKKKKEDSIRDYIFSTSDKKLAVNEIIKLFVDITKIENYNSHEIAESIAIAIQTLKNNKEDYISCVSTLLTSETIDGIDLKLIVEPLFCFLSSKDVFDLLNGGNQKNKNKWLFAYYYSIPQGFITQRELNGLYKFLIDDSDRYIHVSPNRDINFLNKYLEVDDNVIITSSKIILSKREYSPFMVSLYFELQFNEHYIAPSEVIQKYNRDLNLLEQIYLCVIEESHLADYKGTFLHALFEKDNTFVKNYSKWFVLQAEKGSIRNDYRVEVLFQEEEYLNIVDFIVEESIATWKAPIITVPSLIKLLLASSPGKNRDQNEKKDCWINHFISNNCTEKNKMIIMFTALTELSLERAIGYIKFFADCNEDFNVFAALPLIPPSYSWTGSKVPMYSSWIEQLTKLLPQLYGLKYAKHKNKVQLLIDELRNKINEEEISDILKG